MSTQSMIKRRYYRRVAITMAIYVISLLAADYLIEDAIVSGPFAYLLALIPGLAVVGLFYAVGRFIIEQTDEFMRMLAVRQQLIATGFLMSVAVVWGMLQEFKLVPHVGAVWIVVLWAIGTVIGAASNRIAHGAWGEC